MCPSLLGSASDITNPIYPLSGELQGAWEDLDVPSYIVRSQYPGTVTPKCQNQLCLLISAFMLVSLCVCVCVYACLRVPACAWLAHTG